MMQGDADKTAITGTVGLPTDLPRITGTIDLDAVFRKALASDDAVAQTNTMIADDLRARDTLSAIKITLVLYQDNAACAPLYVAIRDIINRGEMT